MRRCANDAATKATEVADGMRRFGNYPGMADLYRQGRFRHLEDVAYARIALQRHGESLESVATHLDDTYEGPDMTAHRCDRVYPPT